MFYVSVELFQERRFFKHSTNQHFDYPQALLIHENCHSNYLWQLFLWQGLSMAGFFFVRLCLRRDLPLPWFCLHWVVFGRPCLQDAQSISTSLVFGKLYLRQVLFYLLIAQSTVSYVICSLVCLQHVFSISAVLSVSVPLSIFDSTIYFDNIICFDSLIYFDSTFFSDLSILRKFSALSSKFLSSSIFRSSTLWSPFI